MQQNPVSRTREVGGVLSGACQHDCGRDYLGNMMHPTTGLINTFYIMVWVKWTGLARRCEDRSIVSRACAMYGKDLGIATVIFIAGIKSIRKNIMRLCKLTAVMPGINFGTSLFP